MKFIKIWTVTSCHQTEWNIKITCQNMKKKRKHITHTKGGTDGQMWMTLKQITSVGFENLLLFWAAFICIFYFEKFSTWIWCLPFAVYMKFKTESTRKLSNFDFQWTKILYQNNLKHIAFFFTFFKG